jgi:hypothetical protein
MTTRIAILGAGLMAVENASTPASPKGAMPSLPTHDT